jgi:hypothetical protein
MKKCFLFFAAIVLSALAVPRASAAISVSVFYDSLEPYGEWLEVADYGYVWHPADIDDQWQPYTAGHWVFTDAGWTWMSDEPFGWAVYHYGRWARVQPVGWVWVPETEWGPAWVSWRRSPRHVGWAPLPPEARFRRDVALSTWVDAYYDIGPTYYNFVEVRQFGAPRLREVLVPHRENITIINETRNITNITYTNNVVFNGGPDYDVIVRESAQPIRRLRLDRVTEIDERDRDRRDAWRPRVEGDTVRMIAPAVDGGAGGAPKKVARRIEKAEIDRGWKGIADQGNAQKLRAAIKSQAKVPPALPPQPKFEPVATRNDERAKPGAAAAPAATAETAPGAPSPAATTAEKDAAGTAEAATAKKPMRTADRPGEKARAKRRQQTSAQVGVDDANSTPAADESAPGAAAPNAKAADKAKKGTKSKKETAVATPDAAGEPAGPGITSPSETSAPDSSAATIDKKMRLNAKEGRNVATPEAELPENSVDRPDARAKTDNRKERAAKKEDDASSSTRERARRDESDSPAADLPQKAGRGNGEREVPKAERELVPREAARRPSPEDSQPKEEIKHRPPQDQPQRGDAPANVGGAKRGPREGAAGAPGSRKDDEGKRKKEKDAES